MTDDTHHARGARAVRVLAFAASMRGGSLNDALVDEATSMLEQLGVIVDRATMPDFDVQSYDGDVEQRDGIPDAAVEFGRRLEACDGLLIASPEYNAAMPGVLKNAIDWASRLRPQPFHARHCLLMSASPSMVGGNRGLWSLRVPLEHLGTRVHPDMFSLAQAHRQLDDDRRIADEQLRERLRSTISAWIELVDAAKNYPCAKARWIEFLGEHPDEVLDRVE
jgi:NAD(P)H-dependent FMN reductase